MSFVHYDVDKDLDLDRLLIVEVEESISLYCHGDLSEIVLGDTLPEFLARFRRAKYDGTLYPLRSLQLVEIPAGSRIVIKKDGGVGLILPSGLYYEFDMKDFEKLEQRDFPEDQFGEFDSYIGITFDNFMLFLDSFKTKRRKPSSKPTGNTYIVDEDEPIHVGDLEDDFIT